MNLKPLFCFMLCTAALLPVYSCNGANPAANTKPVTVANPKPIASVANDEQLFRLFLKQFKLAAKQKNTTALAGMFIYPAQTNPQWTNKDLQNTKHSPADGLMDKAELKQYLSDIFSKDALRLIPLSGEDALSEIDKTTPEDYYKQLTKKTDKGTTLYELNIQYPQDNGQETSFGFVFGKVGGNYKILSYFRPWPLK